MDRHRTVYGPTGDGGLQLGAGADRWHLYDDYVHLAPQQTGADLLRFDAELLPFVDDPARGAVAVIDMQNDFCAPGGWTDRSGLDYRACRAAVPGVRRAVDAARRHGMWVIWIYWHNRPDLRNIGAPTLFAFKHRPPQRGIGEDLDRGRVLTAGSWGAQLVDDLRDYVHADDIRVEKVRMSGFYGTHLDQVLRTQGIRTLFLAGVNVDQCVSTTMEDACFRDYNAVLLEDATATSSPGHCKDAVVFNAKQCWGFVTTTERFAGAQPYPPSSAR